MTSREMREKMRLTENLFHDYGPYNKPYETEDEDVRTVLQHLQAAQKIGSKLTTRYSQGMDGLESAIYYLSTELNRKPEPTSRAPRRAPVDHRPLLPIDEPVDWGPGGIDSLKDELAANHAKHMASRVSPKR